MNGENLFGKLYCILFCWGPWIECGCSMQDVYGHSPEDRRLQLWFYCVRSYLQSKTERRDFDSAKTKIFSAVKYM